jgi:hypothetical protein
MLEEFSKIEDEGNRENKMKEKESGRKAGRRKTWIGE